MAFPTYVFGAVDHIVRLNHFLKLKSVSVIHACGRTLDNQRLSQARLIFSGVRKWFVGANATQGESVTIMRVCLATLTPVRPIVG
tara:strand:+ start:592 stop:846 length:255 start_codon:yes stop_codon:yes gene_type:complete